jgi:hypothetical protein
VKFASERPYADAGAAARKLVEIANTVEAVQDGRIHIEKINEPFLRAGGSPTEYVAGPELALARGMVLEARIRRLCEVHAGGRRSLRVSQRVGNDLFEEPTRYRGVPGSSPWRTPAKTN